VVALEAGEYQPTYFGRSSGVWSLGISGPARHSSQSWGVWSVVIADLRGSVWTSRPHEPVAASVSLTTHTDTKVGGLASEHDLLVDQSTYKARLLVTNHWRETYRNTTCGFALDLQSCAI
jgi:hypothetical protein